MIHGRNQSHPSPAGPHRGAPRRGLGVIPILAFLLLAPPRASAASGPAEAWIYLRGGEAPAPEERLVEVVAVGDVMTGRGNAGIDDLFAEVAGTLSAADLTLGNLEGAISDEPVPPHSVWLHLPLDTPAMLAEAGFDLLSVENNHALDAGRAGLAQTRRFLRAADLEPVAASPAVMRELDDLTFAFLAWNDLGDPDRAPLIEAVRAARVEADVVVVMVHWGREYQRHPSLPQGELAQQLLAAGADVVAGAHPHVVQDLNVVEPAAGDRARLVAFSLGNFAFDQGWGDTGQGLALRLLFDKAGLRAAQALPLWTAPRPRWMTPDAAADLLARIIPPERMGFACFDGACERVDASPASRTGVFTSGAIDLTGDGRAELVRLREDAVEILQSGRSVWRSPADWIVRDVALGDPNNDGRFEAVLAVDKSTADGSPISQPFVIGYRIGTYRDLWGGSPVEDPILEVELGDVDGDGLEELIAIEAPDESARYLTVWRWHGWGFSLVWRSPPGAYRDLLLLPAGGGQPATISVGT